MILILFPHQLFEHEPVEMFKSGRITQVILWEDPVFYGDRRGSAHGPQMLRLNRMRILYMRVAMRVYHEWLISRSVHATRTHVYDLWNTPIRNRYNTLRESSLIAFDPADHLLKYRMRNLQMEYVDSPSFLMSSDWMNEYSAKVKKGKRLQHAAFFTFMKTKLNILVSTPSTDMENRRPYPKGAHLPPSPHVQLQHGSKRRTWWDEEVAELKRRDVFWKNAGPLEDPMLPITHRDVASWLQKFVRERFGNYGKYQDAVVAGSQWMNHSGLSVYLNMGLIRPHDVLHALAPFYRTKSIQNYEGFVRQIVGWREFSRFYYTVVPPSTYNKNVFDCTREPLPKSWYHVDKDATGLQVVDEAIRDAWTYGYLHHIRRLMVLSNYMVLTHVHPDRVFAWMYEFSLDSWDWVMVFNVYSMGTWSDGGYAMRKPYISGAHYLQTMASMNKKEDIATWNELFRTFLMKHAGILSHTQLARFIPS